MCGRYSFAPKPKQLAESLADILLPDQLEISFNIAPTQQAYVIASDSPVQLQKMEWGLVPHWSQEGKNEGKLINARSEGIEEKPSFRTPVQSKRCLIPADSFYEWKKIPGGRKMPYRILAKNGSLLLMAGIWDEWRLGNVVKKTFSIITTTPNLEVSNLHNRMPVIFPDADTAQKWLADSVLTDALALLKPMPDDTLTMYPVSERINKPDVDDPSLQTAVQAPLDLFNQGS